MRITEINYNPKGSQGGTASEFVEVQNIGATAVDLSTWFFEGIEFIFPVGQTLGAGDRLVIASNNAPATFAAQFPGVVVPAILAPASTMRASASVFTIKPVASSRALSTAMLRRGP